MEIKVVYGSFPYKGKETTIVEGKNISHRQIFFESKNDFLFQFGNLPKSEESFILGVPEYFWTHENPEDNTIRRSFVFITYTNNEGNFSTVIAMNCIVFITNNGQTIDKIESSN